MITEASIALDLDADTSMLGEDEFYIVDVSTNLPISPNISPVSMRKDLDWAYRCGTTVRL